MLFLGKQIHGSITSRLFFQKQVVILISILLMWNVTPISSNLISVQLSLKSLNKRKIDEQGKTAFAKY